MPEKTAEETVAAIRKGTADLDDDTPVHIDVNDLSLVTGEPVPNQFAPKPRDPDQVLYELRQTVRNAKAGIVTVRAADLRLALEAAESGETPAKHEARSTKSETNSKS